MTFQEVAEVFLGNLVLRNKFHYIAPFFKQINHTIRMSRSFHDIEDFKASLSQLDYRCSVTDPSRIVDHYLDPWWIEPSLETNMHIHDGLPDFLRQVCFTLGLIGSSPSFISYLPDW